MMRGKEKIYFLLDTIVDARAITPSGQPLIIDPMNDLHGKLSDLELSQLFTKLEKDEQVLKVLKVPSRIKTIDIVEDLDPYDQPYGHDDGCWHIELLSAFDNYFLKIQQEPEYQEFTGKKPAQPAEANQKAPDVNVVYEITYSSSREILLNKTFQLAKPDFNSENDLVFGFLFQNPNKKHTLEEIEEATGNKLGKSLHKIVENLGFKGDLRKIFMDVSETAICFKNPITSSDLEKLGIIHIKFS